MRVIFSSLASLVISKRLGLGLDNRRGRQLKKAPDPPPPSYTPVLVDPDSSDCGGPFQAIYLTYIKDDSNCDSEIPSLQVSCIQDYYDKAALWNEDPDITGDTEQCADCIHTISSNFGQYEIESSEYLAIFASSPWQEFQNCTLTLPTGAPTNAPTQAPTFEGQTAEPTGSPTKNPTQAPTFEGQTAEPTNVVVATPGPTWDEPWRDDPVEPNNQCDGEGDSTKVYNYQSCPQLLCGFILGGVEGDCTCYNEYYSSFPVECAACLYGLALAMAPTVGLNGAEQVMSVHSFADDIDWAPCVDGLTSSPTVSPTPAPTPTDTTPAPTPTDTTPSPVNPATPAPTPTDTTPAPTPTDTTPAPTPTDTTPAPTAPNTILILPKWYYTAYYSEPLQALPAFAVTYFSNVIALTTKSVLDLEFSGRRLSTSTSISSDLPKHRRLAATTFTSTESDPPRNVESSGATVGNTITLDKNPDDEPADVAVAIFAALDAAFGNLTDLPPGITTVVPNTDPPPTESKSETGAIVGGIFGGLALLALIFFISRTEKNKGEANADDDRSLGAELRDLNDIASPTKADLEKAIEASDWATVGLMATNLIDDTSSYASSAASGRSSGSAHSNMSALDAKRAKEIEMLLENDDFEGVADRAATFQKAKTPTKESLGRAIETENWALVAAMANEIDNDETSYSSSRATSVASGTQSDQTEKAAEIERLIAAGDWDAVALASANFEKEAEGDGGVDYNAPDDGTVGTQGSDTVVAETDNKGFIYNLLGSSGSKKKKEAGVATAAIIEQEEQDEIAAMDFAADANFGRAEPAATGGLDDDASQLRNLRVVEDRINVPAVVEDDESTSSGKKSSKGGEKK